MEQPEVQNVLETEGAPPEELQSENLSAADSSDAQLKALVEAVIYITDEPLSADQIAIALQQPAEKVGRVLEGLTAEYNRPEHGLTIREIAGGYKMSTKPEHHEAVRAFVKNLKPALKLSLAALETLALIAYKQPITAPEIMDVRGVQGAGVLKTLLDRKLIATAGRKQVVGKPIVYKTTKEFLVQFGLKDLSELPSLKEFQELARLDTENENVDIAEAPVSGSEPTPVSESESTTAPASEPEPAALPVTESEP